MRAFIFPGQGSQAVGMGSALADASPVARAVFEEVDDALGQKLFALMTDGPADDLLLTENAQPAIMANAIATLRVAEKEGGIRLADRADFVAGHSLGEYTALCAAGALDLATTARLLRLRGRAMQAAVPVGEGAMAALLGADLEKAQAIAAAAVEAVAAEGGGTLVCTVANDNDPSQVVISGHRAAIERAVALADADLRAPLVPLYCNVDAAPIADPDAIRAALVRQVTGMVRWRESVLAMAAAGTDRFVEFGGKVLAPMVKRISPDVEATSVVTMDDVGELVKTL